MHYVDGYVLVVPTKHLKAYKKMATKGCKIWRKHGALDYKECVGDDMKSSMDLLPFPKLMKAKEDETIIFAYVVFQSRKHRDQVNAKVFADPEMNPDAMMKDNPMPFDMKRMAYGGFEAMVEA
jgi:alkaline phosphatase